MSLAERCRAKRTHDGRRAVFTGTPWSYWQVYVGLSLALLLVTTGLTLAIQNLERTGPAEELAANSENDISIPGGDIQEPKTNVPAAQVKGSTADVPVDVAVAKPIPALPLRAAKITREPEISPPESSAKTEPAKEQIQIVEAKPEPALPAPKVRPAQDKRDPTCGTAIHFVHSPAVANREALKEDKLVFVLHVSGNFEDPQFT
jgi:hypothetical protein